ncbi:ATP-dependent RNA helicase DbpA [Thalassotalea litorea]|uniref:ATP-dependent RNA helicase DbpA n=1 Tax=Thalassotalea litorea TaxID=2020715 RepID=A0A5R9IFB5_9GAMM|nr:ATP-dependent RNA helicase DbpA [Thalassotalea litorea]TLU64210.1 ATP-dependent RNA helicase DbpA [Thalassotalea litorea]
MDNTQFQTLPLRSELTNNLTHLGYQQMTEVQALSLPAIVSGRDVIAQAKTGSGKTAAFGLGLLQKLDEKAFRIQTLVLCPTRELAEQVALEIRKLARLIHNIKVLTLCGGVPTGRQVDSLRHGAHIIVGTPGRVEDHLGRGSLNLNHVNTLVLDEADRMLDMGFEPAIERIFKQIPASPQVLLFSATFADNIHAISRRYMHKPEHIVVAQTHNQQTIAQRFYQVHGADDKLLAVRLLIQDHKPVSTVIFCNTKLETVQLSEQLQSCGYSAVALNGDLEQRERDQAMIQFANKSVSVLVATDVAARGLDVDNLDLVINYSLAHDTEIHTHRIGRTGRAGNQGVACSFYSEKDHHKMALLNDLMDTDIVPERLPDKDILQLPVIKPPMATIQILGGKKQKVRAGDIVGALTRGQELSADDVGKIQLLDNLAYVAVKQKIRNVALAKIVEGKLKGRKFKARIIRR